MTFTAVNPATEEVIAEYPGHTPEQVEAALALAATAFQSWTPRSPSARGHGGRAPN